MKTIKVFMAILSSIGLFFGCAKAETSSLENAPEAYRQMDRRETVKALLRPGNPVTSR